MGIRLQGTDGIRGPIQQQLPPSQHPVQWYLKKQRNDTRIFPNLYIFNVLITPEIWTDGGQQ